MSLQLLQEFVKRLILERFTPSLYLTLEQFINILCDGNSALP